MSNMQIDQSIQRIVAALPQQPLPLVEVDNLRVRFGPQAPAIIKGISFALQRGECLALVGESGSGKSVTSRALVGLAGYRSHVSADRLAFNGADLGRFNE